MTGSQIERLLSVLDRQTDNKVPPNMLLGYLGMMNLMSIMSLVQGEASANFNLPALTGDTMAAGGNENQLKDTISNLLGGGAKSTAPDLSGLLNMVTGAGGNKKLNPQMLLTLMNLANSMAPKVESASPKAETKEVKEQAQAEGKSESSQGKSEKKRGFL